MCVYSRVCVIMCACIGVCLCPYVSEHMYVCICDVCVSFQRSESERGREAPVFKGRLQMKFGGN